MIHSIYMAFKLIFDEFWREKVKMCHYLKPNLYGINSGVRLGKSYHAVLREVQT